MVTNLMLTITQLHLVQILFFAPVFAPRLHMGSIERMDPKLPSKCRDVSWPSPPIPSSKSFFSKVIPSVHSNYKARAIVGDKN